MSEEEKTPATPQEGKATLSPDGGKTVYSANKATLKTQKTETGEILQEIRADLPLHEALPLLLQIAAIRAEEKVKRDEIVNFFKNHITMLDIIPGTGDEFGINYRIEGSDEDKPEELKAKAMESFQNPVVAGILRGLAKQLREFKKRAEEEEGKPEDKKEKSKRVKREPEKLKKERGLLKERGLTKYAIHAVAQFFGDNKQLSLFSDEKIDTFSRDTGLPLGNRPDSYGVVLNQTQRRVFDGILKAFSDSNYTGDEEIDKATYNKDFHPIIKIGGAYSNVNKIPVLRLTQAKIIELSGYDLKSQRQGDKVDVIEALSFLATKQFCFYWLRLKKEKGKPVKDKNGDYIKEEVMEVGSLLRIKTVRTAEGELQYYEIHPSAPVLDQVNNYFLLVPYLWREEVKRLTGKRASSYTYEFLFWLRVQYEQIRRHNEKKNTKKKAFKINRSWEEIAIALKMPESMYKANRKRAAKIIQEAYSIAIKLGYLLKVENNGADILYLNEAYYPKPGELV